METIYVFGGFLDERSSSTGRLRTSLVFCLRLYTRYCPGIALAIILGYVKVKRMAVVTKQVLHRASTKVGPILMHSCAPLRTDIRCTAITERNTHSYRAGAAIPRRAYRTQRHTQRMTNNDDYWTGGYMSGSTPIKYSLTQYLQSAAHVYHTA